MGMLASWLHVLLVAGLCCAGWGRYDTLSVGVYRAKSPGAMSVNQAVIGTQESGNCPKSIGVGPAINRVLKSTMCCL
jgi:hypothetical protein